MLISATQIYLTLTCYYTCITQRETDFPPGLQVVTFNLPLWEWHGAEVGRAIGIYREGFLILLEKQTTLCFAPMSLSQECRLCVLGVFTDCSWRMHKRSKFQGSMPQAPLKSMHTVNHQQSPLCVPFHSSISGSAHDKHYTVSLLKLSSPCMAAM